MGYLIENNECERTYLAKLGWSWSALEPVLRSLNIHPHCCWALIEVEMDDLASSMNTDTRNEALDNIQDVANFLSRDHRFTERGS
jgi:hypothetical protein